MKKLVTHKRWMAKATVTLLVCCLIVIFSGCKKLVDVKPPSTTINSANVYARDATAIAAVTNIYVTMSRAELQGGGITALSLFPGLSSDELSLSDGATNNAVSFYYKNQLSSINLNEPDFWTVFYQTIYNTNAAIDGLSSSITLTDPVKQQLVGEAKFMRAFCYFYLVNLYGDIPLALGSDYTLNVSLARAPKLEAYRQIITDLKDAQRLLKDNYLNGTLTSLTAERVRPTKWAATALLARAYLYSGEYANAENEASAVINYNSLYGLDSLSQVFKKNSREAIWQLQPVNGGWNTEDARTFILPASGPNSAFYPFYLSSQFISSFESNDQRKLEWVGNVTANGVTYYFPNKYKSATYNNPVTEYQMVLRLGEQYLIRAEAKAKQNNLSGAIADIDMIRQRAGLPLIAITNPGNNQTALLNAILHERQVELFSEWGHRWFDLKRTEMIDSVMSIVTPQKGGTWNTNWQWYPISNRELLINSSLVQNAGY